MTDEQQRPDQDEQTHQRQPRNEGHGEDQGRGRRNCPLGAAAEAMGCDPKAARRFCMHMGRAGLEMLRAFESLLQAAAEETPPKASRKATKITID